MGAPRILAPTTISGGIPTAGAGTLNTVALWTPDGFTLGNSLLTQAGSVITNATGAIRANGTTQTTPAFMRYDATNSGIYFPAANEIGFTISGQHAMFISSGRLVGIGTTNPGAKLHVVGNTWITSGNLFTDTIVPYSGGATPLAIASLIYARVDTNTVGIGTVSPWGALTVARAAGSDAYVELGGGGRTAATSAFVGQDAAGHAYLWNRSNAFIYLGTNNLTRAVVDGSGNVGIGTASPGFKCVVADTVAGVVTSEIRNDSTNSAATARLRFTTQGGESWIEAFRNAGGALTFATLSTERARIDSSGVLTTTDLATYSLSGTTASVASGGTSAALFTPAASSEYIVYIQATSNTGVMAHAMVLQNGAASGALVSVVGSVLCTINNAAGALTITNNSGSAETFRWRALKLRSLV
jgi:hypothetical protein